MELFLKAKNQLNVSVFVNWSDSAKMSDWLVEILIYYRNKRTFIYKKVSIFKILHISLFKEHLQ